jgi:hypothetical protein
MPDPVAVRRECRESALLGDVSMPSDSQLPLKQESGGMDPRERPSPPCPGHPLTAEGSRNKQFSYPWSDTVTLNRQDNTSFPLNDGPRGIIFVFMCENVVSCAIS